MLIKVEKIREIIELLLQKLESIEDYELRLGYTTYWKVNFKKGLKLVSPAPEVADMRDIVKELKRSSQMPGHISSEEFEMLGDLIKAIGVVMEIMNEDKERE